MGIKETGEILGNPLKLQQYQLQALMIKTEKRRWYYAWFGFITGLVISLSGVGAGYLLGTQSNIRLGLQHEQELLLPAATLEVSIQDLKASNTILTARVRNLEDSLYKGK
jgi:hypothetical protein